MSSHVTRETACPLDCPDSCSLTVTIEDGRVAKIDASPRHAVTGGYICGKVRNFAAHLYGDARLREPAVRTGPRGSGQFRPRASSSRSAAIMKAGLREGNGAF